MKAVPRAMASASSTLQCGKKGSLSKERSGRGDRLSQLSSKSSASSL